MVLGSAISNTSPLLYLYRAGFIGWLPQLFEEIWTVPAVADELNAGLAKGFTALRVVDYAWIQVRAPQAVPSPWLTYDLGAGELAAIALALENPQRIVLLDDAQARRVAQAAGLTVWGTLKVLLEAKRHGLTATVSSALDALVRSGMWMTPALRDRVLRLAEE